MIRCIGLLTIFTCFLLSSNAQTSRFEYGIQGGLNINSASGKGVSKDFRGVLTGLSLGGHFKFKANERFGVKVLVAYDENGYSYRGLTFENSAGNGLVKADVFSHFNYLNIPLLAEYSFGNKVQINLGAGAFVGFLLNNKTVTNFKEPLPPGQPSSITSSNNNNKHNINYGISIGFGVQVPVTSNIKIDFDVRNHTGLAGIYKGGGASGNSKIETNCFAILGGVSFAL